jgi:hypothetical protein
VRPLALALLAAACAAPEEARAPAVPPFRDVRTLVLVRSVDERGHRAKDALDGLDETLRGRGFTTRVVELGPGSPPEHAAVARLFHQLEQRAAASRGERTARPVTSAGPKAGSVVAGLGADALASYHRLERRRAPGLPTAAAGAPLSSRAQAVTDRPTGALVLVDRAGRVATFAWGDAGALDDPTVPLNAAEAIELLARALAGEPSDE